MLTPQDVGMPDKFCFWREGQAAIIDESFHQTDRILVQVVPTGGGKSAGYIASALLFGGRTIILTSTKGLQDQLEHEFGEVITIIKGQSAYKCKVNYHTVHNGPCHWGYQCRFKLAGCPYYDQIRKAQRARIVVTNYSFWMSNGPDVLGDFDYLIGDEAHSVVDHLLDNQAVHLSQRECEQVAAWPRPGGNVGFYQIWASVVKSHVNKTLATIKERGDTDSPEAMDLLALSRKINKLDKVRGTNWVAEHLGKSIHFDPIWPDRGNTEKDLFRGIGKVLLTSATVNRKTMEIIGMGPDQYKYTEYPSYFAAGRRPIIYVPTVRMDHHVSNAGMNLWLATINNIIRPRLHRKGLIHTVSYDRASIVFNSSEFKEYMIRHDRKSTKDMVDRFKRLDPPAILVSPSISTGWDFPFDECRWQIIGKVPFPDGRSLIAEARTKVDPDYSPYNTMQTIVQACGRGMRLKDDYCETFINDDHWAWFLPKYKRFAPLYFQQAARTSLTIPPPIGR